MTSASALDRWFPAVVDLPLIEFVGATPVDATDPAAGLRLRVSQNSANAANVMHGGVFAILLDLAAYLAVLPTLAATEQAVTHSFNASYLSAVGMDAMVVARAQVLRRTRYLAFVESRVIDSDDRTVATASVAKSIVPAKGIEPAR